MSKFLTGKELENTVYDIIWKASNTLLIISPYINLDTYFRKLFENHLNNPRLHIIIVFGKNENNVKKSLSSSDFDFFKKFMNISILYIPNLHGKYYANDTQSVITSINLYDYSFKNNIEFGVFQETNILGSLATSVDRQAWDKCWEITYEAEAVFIKRPVFEKKLLAMFGKNYIKSDVLLDKTESYYTRKVFNNRSNNIKHKLSDFLEEIELGSSPTNRPERHEIEQKNTPSVKPKPQSQVQTGYCIRTGKPIPFNPSQPFCYEAYQQWAQWGNPDYRESYCHRTGQPSNGKTSKNNPILNNSYSRI
ncbi:MAG: phospholipase D family protein [Lentimicrobiaceae bacterium]|jgi:hypothetical protein